MRTSRAARLLAALLLWIAPLSSLAQGTPPQRILGFDGGAGWLNGTPPTPEGLRGRVVLVDFWEYTCINCLRTLPYLREWYRRYRDDGFVIVGVHTPEFDFSGERANVEAAAKRLGVTWPTVLDDRDEIWKRYGNESWPHEYLFDQQGRLVESFTGEGGYALTEARIQALLKQANPSRAMPPAMALLPQDSYDKPGAVCYPKTEEILVGHGGIANLRSVGNPAQESNFVYDGSTPSDGSIFLQGYWHVTPEAAVSGESNGFLVLRYHAVQLVAVLRPERGGSIHVNVTQDGQPVPKEDAGKDLRYGPGGNSYVDVDEPRAYDLVMNARFGDHTIALTPSSDGLGVYDFAFESCEVPH
ncbi:MAG TPA: redoxin family protein [Candidatus Cybelea sp.]|nr:redoxin family protein [Candidatus Cybelea sp.]